MADIRVAAVVVMTIGCFPWNCAARGKAEPPSMEPEDVRNGGVSAFRDPKVVTEHPPTNRSSNPCVRVVVRFSLNFADLERFITCMFRLRLERFTSLGKDQFWQIF